MVRFKVSWLRRDGGAIEEGRKAACAHTLHAPPPSVTRLQNRWLLVHVDFASDDTEVGPATPGIAAAAAGGGGGGSGGAGGTPMQLVLLRALRDLVQTHFGDVGGGAIGGSLAVRYYSPTTKTAVVRCARLGAKHVWAAMTLCTHLAGRRVRLLVTHCGGTIRKVQQAAIRLDQRVIARLCAERRLRARLLAAGQGAALSMAKASNCSDAAIVDGRAVGSSATMNMPEGEELDAEATEALAQSERAISALQP